MNLDGARVLITGSSIGIGAATAALLKERGARVFLNGRDADRLAGAMEELGLPGHRADVGKREEAIALVEAARGALGGIDVLINNAGWGRRMPLGEVDAEVMHAIWETNVLGVVHTTQAALEDLERAKGAIVNIASTAALRGYAGGTAYCSSKFALRGLTECWRAELRPRDIRVLLVNPSEVQTCFFGGDPDRELDPRKLHAEDIAHAIGGALEMDDRGFIPELSVFATNPFPAG
ncbi:MAG: SDR family oxidoreductase [Planctomycetota bacterium]|jgi:3-oxoacyl-[acyl-carrier protein] reductase